MISQFYSSIAKSVVWEWMPQLLEGVRHTLEMALLSFALSVILGLIVALMRMSEKRVISWTAIVFIEVFRGTPLLVQLFIIYYALPAVGLIFSPFVAGVIGLTLNSAAYISEIYRSGFLSIDAGQKEAGKAIGMTGLQIQLQVLIPQAVLVSIPNLAGYGVTILKSTSLASIVSAPDLMMYAHDLSSEYFMPMKVYLITALLYIIMAYPLSRGAQHLEKVMGRGRR
ncbi:amino acid ABC transporter permease [Undibacter mobilis]|uniref:Amino acid ABC transporter permease n=2 Tax=Undibacter mobilis TaxID=2292256 RepID=A0A371BAR7_9BRAD|nr:amino acid ABC transporter permease [Undibacter mobilis]